MILKRAHFIRYHSGFLASPIDKVGVGLMVIQVQAIIAVAWNKGISILRGYQRKLQFQRVLYCWFYSPETSRRHRPPKETNRFVFKTNDQVNKWVISYRCYEPNKDGIIQARRAFVSSRYNGEASGVRWQHRPQAKQSRHFSLTFNPWTPNYIQSHEAHPL